MKKIVDLDKFHKHCDEHFSRLDTADRYEQGKGIGLLMAFDWLEKQPDAEEKHGKWLPTKEDNIRKCSLCGAQEGEGTAVVGCYCWRCGANMDLGGEE